MLTSVSIHVPLAEHDGYMKRFPDYLNVSIHVPLAEHDSTSSRDTPHLIPVSIHVPLAEHDRFQGLAFADVYVSIHVPLAEHDCFGRAMSDEKSSFNSRAPRGARPEEETAKVGVKLSFNSRAPRGARPLSAMSSAFARMFQFTCPSRSTTAANLS